MMPQHADNLPFVPTGEGGKAARASGVSPATGSAGEAGASAVANGIVGGHPLAAGVAAMSPCTNPTRQALLDAAERLFSTRGYADVGIREIADAAGANVAAISYHFGSKRELYVETVRQAMIRSGQTAWKLLAESSPRNPDEAAALLALFVRRFISHMLPPQGVDPCGTLIIREGLQPSEALEAVVQHNIQPNEAAMVKLLGAIAPQIDRDELCWYAASVLGQLTHYRVFRPIVEQLRGESLSEPARQARLAAHIASFTLRGLGCDQAMIERALARAEEPTTLVAGETEHSREPASERT